MLGYVRAVHTTQRRARAGFISFALLVGACNDVVLDLANETAQSGDIGEAGAASAAPETGEAGSAGAGANEPSLDDAGFCGDAVGDCLYREGTLTCSGDVGETAIQALAGERARLVVDMTNATELRVAFELCDPDGYVLNIGDSPSNNGGGGD